MLTPDQQAVALGAIRDPVLAIAKGHEREAHDGRPCPANRASVVAFFAHCLGVRGRPWDYAEHLLAEYDVRCADATCDHGLEEPDDADE